MFLKYRCFIQDSRWLYWISVFLLGRFEKCLNNFKATDEYILHIEVYTKEESYYPCFMSSRKTSGKT